MSQKIIEEYHPTKYHIYHYKDDKHYEEDIMIYEDDSINEIYYKISSKEKVSYEYIHIWYFDNDKKYNLLGYKYEEIESLKDLYELKEDEYVKECIDEDGLQILNAKNYDLHKTLENIYTDNNRIYYTTLQDYLSHIKINPKDINSDKWSREIKYLQFINGKIRVYWPELTEKLIIEKPDKKLNKKLKNIAKIVKNTNEVLDKIYSFNNLFKPDTIIMNTFVLGNIIKEENIVNIAQIFNDIKLGKYKDYVLLFSKIMLENYTESHYKVRRDFIKNKNKPENPLSEGDFLRLTKGTIISLMNLKPRYLDLSRSLSLVFYKDNLFINLNINDKGNIRLIIESFIVDEIDHETIMKDMNSFIKKNILSQKIYLGINKDLELISTDINDILKNPINLANYSLEYNIKNFDVKVLEKMINNLSVFLRIENISDSKIHIIYKRINEYNSIAGKLKIISKITQETDKREEIINRIAEIFNILDEDAVENYEIWKQLNKKGYKNVQEGVDIIIEGFKSSHIRISIGGCSNKNEITRINHLLNTLISCYYEYIERKKDRLSLMKKKKIDEELLDLSDEDFIESQQEEVPQQQEEVPLEEDEDSGSSESIEMGLLDELDSDDEESFGGYSNEIKGGGYDLRSYYLNRLSKNAKYDNELFKFTTGKSHQSKKGELKGTYARACSANYSRHPIALTEKELNEIKDNPDYGEGIGYSNAIKIEGRPTTINGDIYYICPKYWDVKNETPLDPLKLDDFRDNVFGMDYSKNPSGDPIKTTSKDKANSDKYVLVRSGYHWTNAGDDIMRYKVEPMKNVHPDGFDVPCCNVERLEKIKKNDKIEWYNEKDKTWNRGICIKSGSDKDDKKPYTIKTEKGDEIQIIRRFIKKYKDNKHISNSIPCNDGKYCHINDILKNYIGQNVEMPKKGESDRGIYKLGLVRKGINRKKDSLLMTLCELLKKKNIEELIKDIIEDLKKCDNLFKISNGSFVNHFYSELKEIDDKDVERFIKFLLKQPGIIKRHFQILTKDNFKKENLFKGTPMMVSLNSHYYKLYSSIINCEKYLKDNTEKDDRFIISVLCSIMKIEGNTTFGEMINNTNILVLEELNENIVIKEPIGGFKKDFDKLYLIYKYRDNYEPIFMNIFEEYKPLIDPYNISSKYEDTIKNGLRIDNKFESIREFLENIINSLKDLLKDGKKKEYKQLPGAVEVIEILKECELPIVSAVYDDYGYIRFIETIKDCLIPVKPTTLELVENLPFKYIVLVKKRPKYKDVENILKTIDEKVRKEIYLGYLDKINVNVIEYYNKESVKGEKINKHGFYVKEIVVNETSFIPVEKILYKKSEHYEILYKGEINEIDSYISKGGKMIDKMNYFLINKNYKDTLYEYLCRKVYIIYLTDKTLKKIIEKIKAKTFMRDYHKCKSVYKSLDVNIRKFCNFIDEEYDDNLKIIDKEKINIYHIDDIKNEIVYYKILMYISSLFINYSDKDYNRLVSAYINEDMLSNSIKENELYFNYNQIELDEYKYLFSNRSIFLRETNIYNESLTPEQYQKLKKQKKIDEIKVDFDKKYPKMINEYIHKNSLVLKYNKQVSKYSILQEGLKDENKISETELRIKINELIDKNEKKEWKIDEKEMNIIDLFREILGNKINDLEDVKKIVEENKITIAEVYLISYILKKGFNIVIYNEDNTIELMIVITPQCLNDVIEETEMISLIQTNRYLGSISIKNELIFPLDSYSKQYYSILKKQHRRVYDILKTNSTSIKK